MEEAPPTVAMAAGEDIADPTPLRPSEAEASLQMPRPFKIGGVSRRNTKLVPLVDLNVLAPTTHAQLSLDAKTSPP